MKDIYSTPKSELNKNIISSSTKHWGLFLLVSLFCFAGVSFISSFINDLYVHRIYSRDSEPYWNLRLISDLFQSTLYLLVGGYLSARTLKNSWITGCGLLTILFVLNSFRIIGFFHILDATCDRYWYDVLIVIKTPIALFGGGYIGFLHLKQKNILTTAHG